MQSKWNPPTCTFSYEITRFHINNQELSDSCGGSTKSQNGTGYAQSENLFLHSCTLFVIVTL